MYETSPPPQKALNLPPAVLTSNLRVTRSPDPRARLTTSTWSLASPLRPSALARTLRSAACPPADLDTLPAEVGAPPPEPEAVPPSGAAAAVVGAAPRLIDPLSACWAGGLMMPQ